MPQLSFEFDENNHKLILIAPCEQDSAPVTDAAVLKFFNDSEYKHFFYFESEVSKAVALFTQYKTNKSFGKVVRFVIAESRPAKIKIQIAADLMSASAEIVAAYGGRHLTAKQIIHYATQAGVTMGIDSEAVKLLAEKAKNSLPGTISQHVIASGRLPIRGDDSVFELVTKTARERVLQPQESECGKVDMRDLGALISVKPGDNLVRRIPPTRGKAGFDVKGNAVLAEPGVEIPFNIGAGTAISSQDANLLIATVAGLPYELNNGARVDNVLELATVDVSTGHIEFEGGVIVNGDITEGMRLKASGNVTVAGFIENAHVDIDGDLTVMKGIIGRKVDDSDAAITDFTCNVNATGNVCAKYIQNASVTAGKQVQFHGQVIHSRVTADNILGGTEKSPAGKIVGGYYAVSQSVLCATLGALAATKTTFHFFPQLESKLEKKNALLKLRKAKADRLAEIKIAWEYLRDHKDENKVKSIEDTIKAYKLHDKELKKLEKIIEHLSNQIEQQMNGVFLQATRQLFSQIHVKMGEVNFTTSEDMNAIKIVYKNGRFSRG